jgi:hypothetical protein
MALTASGNWLKQEIDPRLPSIADQTRYFVRQ